MARLHQHYRTNIAPQLQEQFGYQNVMQVPRLTKVTLNMGVGEAVGDKKIMEHAVSDLTQIAGQRPIVTNARKSVAGFKIREGWPIRDFRGLSPKAFDGRGNYNLGVREQIIFPEIDYDKIDAIRGLDISITTTARTDEEGRALLRAFNFPFRN